MIGFPKYQEGDIVKFNITIDGEVKEITGEIYIVDTYGTFEQDEEVSYDVMSSSLGTPALFKHIRESWIKE